MVPLHTLYDYFETEHDIIAFADIFDEFATMQTNTRYEYRKVPRK